MRLEDLPEGEGWAIEMVQIATHNGTHMDAPVHFQSKSIDGKRMMSIDEVPLEWFFRPAVKLDFRGLPDGHVVSAVEVKAELRRIGHELKPFDIVLINTNDIHLYPKHNVITSVVEGAHIGNVDTVFIAGD